MSKKYLICFILFFTFLLCEVTEANKAYVPPLKANLSKNKDRLIKLFNNVGIENAESLFSDPRLKLHYEFWTGGEKNAEYEPVMSHRSVERGKQVIIDNFEFLEAVEAKHRVPKEILISIFRVETNLGQQTGKYIVFNSLLTRCISNTRRWKWAQQELVTFLIICKNLSIDSFDVPGSTHGAFGLTQFIPSSFVTFALAWKSEGSPDLFNFEDAIASSASYLQRCGWDSKNEKKMRRAVYAYNWSTSYVNTVFKYAKVIKVSSQEVEKIRQKQIKEQEIKDKIEEPIIQINEDDYTKNIELQQRKGE